MGVCDQKGRFVAGLYVGTGIEEEEKGGSPRSVCIRNFVQKNPNS